MYSHNMLPFIFYRFSCPLYSVLNLLYHIHKHRRGFDWLCLSVINMLIAHDKAKMSLSHIITRDNPTDSSDVRTSDLTGTCTIPCDVNQNITGDRHQRSDDFSRLKTALTGSLCTCSTQPLGLVCDSLDHINTYLEINYITFHTFHLVLCVCISLLLLKTQLCNAMVSFVYTFSFLYLCGYFVSVFGSCAVLCLFGLVLCVWIFGLRVSVFG